MGYARVGSNPADVVAAFLGPDRRANGLVV
jgi:hypothetical protein